MMGHISNEHWATLHCSNLSLSFFSFQPFCFLVSNTLSSPPSHQYHNVASLSCPASSRMKVAASSQAAHHDQADGHRGWQAPIRRVYPEQCGWSLAYPGQRTSTLWRPAAPIMPPRPLRACGNKQDAEGQPKQSTRVCEALTLCFKSGVSRNSPRKCIHIAFRLASCQRRMACCGRWAAGGLLGGLLAVACAA